MAEAAERRRRARWLVAGAVLVVVGLWAIDASTNTQPGYQRELVIEVVGLH